jgi:hypothetical protein
MIAWVESTGGLMSSICFCVLLVQGILSLVTKTTYLGPRFLPSFLPCFSCLPQPEPECGEGIRVHGWTTDERCPIRPLVSSCPIRMRRLATSSCLSYKCRLQIVFSRVASPNSEHVARHWRPIESSLVGGSPSQYVLQLLALAVVCRWLYGCCPTQ